MINAGSQPNVINFKMKLLVLTVNKNDSTSFYRANGILADLKNQINLEITSMDFAQLKNMSWANLVLMDAVFMQRPYDSTAVQMAQYCRDLNIPVWVDYDDYLLEIPIDNQKAYNLFSEKKVQKNIIDTIQLANLVTVSTGALKTALEKLNNNIHVVPNAINTKIFNYRKTQKPNKTILWRGSDTHQLDIYMFAETIFNATQKYSDYNFTYFGFYPWFIPMEKNTKYIKPTDPVIYFRQLYSLAPKIMNVPLVDSLFNRCKSNIAYIEGTFAGAVCLVPEWPEWDLPGAVTYKSPEDYAEKLELLLNDKINIRKKVTQAWDYITNNLTLEIVNKKRVELLKNL